MRELKTVPLNEAKYGITDRFYKDMLINYGEYYYALESCNATIRLYNESVRGKNVTTSTKTKGTDAKQQGDN